MTSHADPPTGLFVTAAEWQIVQAILLRHVPGREVWAFGSRVVANGGSRVKKFSDLDLAVKGGQSLPLSTQAALAEDFTESDLPYKVDIVDWATASERFRAIIESSHVVLIPAG
ncbi:MAG: nucleotidyltransferase domain-containing protein [Acidobacteriaceae bacterium]|jgi:predicted nucleotidyltransferase